MGIREAIARMLAPGMKNEAEVREILSRSPGIAILDDREANHFPMPIEASGKDDVLVGRIRQDISRSDGRGIDLWVSGDQLRKGAALNAIQIAEALIDEGLVKKAVGEAAGKAAGAAR